MSERRWLYRMVRTRGHLVVIACSTVHYIWATTLWLDPARCLWAGGWPPAGVCSVTPISQLSRLGPVLPWLLVGAAILALVPVMRRCTGIAVILCLMPQQVLLIVSAATVAQAMLLGRFADGVVRTSKFLTADQAWPLVMAIIHVVALLWCFLQSKYGDSRTGRIGS